MVKSLRLTEEQLRDIQARARARGAVSEHKVALKCEVPQRKAKYKNEKTAVDGEVFHSKSEAARYQELKLQEHAGEIVDLKRQVSFDLIVNEMLVCRYVCDFQYTTKNGRVVEDTKGHCTAVYVIKRKLMKACRGIEVLET